MDLRARVWCHGSWRSPSSSAIGTPPAAVDLSFLHGVHESKDQREQSSRLVIVSHATEVARLSKEAA